MPLSRKQTTTYSKFSTNGLLLKGGATPTHMKMVLMMSKATLHVHYQF